MNTSFHAATNQLMTDRVIYEDPPSEDITVHTPAVTAFTDDGRYSKLQRDCSVLPQSVALTITGDDNVEAYYGRLDSSEQYIVSKICLMVEGKHNSIVMLSFDCMFVRGMDCTVNATCTLYNIVSNAQLEFYIIACKPMCTLSTCVHAELCTANYSIFVHGVLFNISAH